MSSTSSSDETSASDSEEELVGVAKQSTANLIYHIAPTAFDAYFEHNAARSQTSANVFSALVPSLSPEEYQAAITAVKHEKVIHSDLNLESERRAAFQQMMLQLKAGFNIIAYGYGSKRTLLNAFALDYCSAVGHVIVANAFQPNYSLKDMLNSIETLPGLSLSSGTVESQTRRIHQYFSSAKRHLYLVVHNIDSPPLRTQRAKSCLSLLALNPRIHVIASVDHIAAPLIWSQAECSARKEHQPSLTADPSRGFSWLWHDLTTLKSYDFELAYADRSSIAGVRSKGHDVAAPSQRTAISEAAANHILAAVTQKAKKLFSLMAEKQLEAANEAGDTLTTLADLEQCAIPYDSLYNLARSEFLATSETALRALLGEFRDHNLVLASQGASGEALWIPLRNDRLQSVLRSLEVTPAG